MPGGPRGGSGGDREILIEFIVQGVSVKVTAIHAATGTEASIVGPASAPRGTLEAAVTRKLIYVLNKGKGAG